MAGSRRNVRPTHVAALVVVVLVILSVWFEPNSVANFDAGRVSRGESESSALLATGTDAESQGSVAEPVAEPGAGIDAESAMAPRTAQSIEVTGKVTGCRGTYLCVLAANGAAIAYTRLDASGAFRFSAATPLTSLTFEVHDAGRRARRMPRVREAYEAGSDWDVGELAFEDHATALRLGIESQRTVVASLLAMGTTRVTAEITEHHPHGAPIGSFDFDLAALAARDDDLVTKDVDVSLVAPDVDVVATWSCDRVPNFRVLVDVLPPRVGAPRTSMLRLLASHAVLGRVVTPAGEPCANVRVTYLSQDLERPIPVAVQSGADGELCVLVPPRDKGRLELAVASVRSERTSYDAAAGSTVTMQLPLVGVRVRLLGADQKPMWFSLSSACCEMDAIRVFDKNPDNRVGVAFLEALQVGGWLEFRFGKGQRGVYLVPPSWFANDATVHDVRIDEFVATGDLVVTTPASEARGRAAHAIMQVRGLAELAHYARDAARPESGEWRVDGLPVGEYEVTFITSRRPEPQRVVIPAGGVAEIRGPW